MHYREFSVPERGLAFFAGLFNLAVGLAFFFLPELHWTLLWPVSISPVLDRFIGAIILGNSAGALWLSTEREWARVRPLAIVAVVYGTLVMLGLLYHLLVLHAQRTFWLYFLFDTPFLAVFYGLFLYHDIIPWLKRSTKVRPALRTAQIQQKK
jgi:hypothetical protein